MIRELVLRGGIGHQVGTEELQQSAEVPLLFSHHCIYPLEQGDMFGQNKSNGDVINSGSIYLQFSRQEALLLLEKQTSDVYHQCF